MAIDSSKEIVIDLNSRRVWALGILAVIGFAAVGTYIAALFAFNTPIQELPIRVNAVNTYDTSDVLKGAFNKGGTLRVKATIEMATTYYMNYYYYNYYYFAGSVNYRIIFTISDGSGRPMYITSATSTINPGQVKIHSIDWVIPTGADAGTYTVKAYVWSDFLPGGVALAPTGGSQTFTVS
jgi:hypothetical protein